MGILLKDNMKAVLIGLALVAAVAANEIDVTDSPSDRLFGLLCCNNVRSRCVLACAGQDCTRTCTGLCGVFASRCGPYMFNSDNRLQHPKSNTCASTSTSPSTCPSSSSSSSSCSCSCSCSCSSSSTSSSSNSIKI